MLDKEEAKAIFHEILKKFHVKKIDVTPQLIEYWFQIADTNHDGSISLEEAQHFVKEHLKSFL